MPDPLRFTLTLLAALGSALIGGVFFAFSTFVMRALSRLPAAHGIAAMQSINIVVINPLFLTPFLGTALLCLILSISAILDWHRPGAAYLLAGAILYILGTLIVTIRFNVPRNDALAAADPTSTEAAGLWTRYVRSWTHWNHVRTLAALAAAALLTVALYLSRAGEPA